MRQSVGKGAPRRRKIDHLTQTKMRTGGSVKVVNDYCHFNRRKYLTYDVSIPVRLKRNLPTHIFFRLVNTKCPGLNGIR